jgi:hypothetical protein
MRKSTESEGQSANGISIDIHSGLKLASHFRGFKRPGLTVVAKSMAFNSPFMQK